MRILPPLLTLLLCAAPPLAAWGRKGHQIVARLAILDLPPEPGAWFRGQEALLHDHCSDPDEWKSDPGERTRHFLDLDLYGGQVPFQLSEALAKLGPEAFQQAGQLPWVIQARTKDLAAAFRAGDRQQVAYLTAILSHYVADLHVPLHEAHNYDGQETNQRGVHSRWETGLVDRMKGEPEVRPATPEPDPDAALWKWLQESFALVPAVLKDDYASDPTHAPKGAKPETYWLLFQKRQGATVQDQLAKAGQRTAQLVLQAWIQAGKPPAPPR